MPNFPMMKAAVKLLVRSLRLQVQHVRETGRLNPHRTAQVGICLRAFGKGLLGVSGS